MSLSDSIRTRIESKQKRLVDAQSELTRAETTNLEYMKITAKLELSTDALYALEDLKRKIMVTLQLLEDDMYFYKDIRLKQISEIATSFFAAVRPEEGLQLKVSMPEDRKRKAVYLHLKHISEPDIAYSPPAVELGKFLKNLLSTSLCLTANILGESKEVFLDEALANGSADSLTTLQNLFEAFPFTMYVVDQKPEMYDQLERREFHLDKEHKGGVRDYRGYTTLLETRDVSKS